MGCKDAKDWNLGFSWVVDNEHQRSQVRSRPSPGRSTLPTLQIAPYQPVWGFWTVISLQPAARPPSPVPNLPGHTHHGPGSKGQHRPSLCADTRSAPPFALGKVCASMGSVGSPLGF